MKTTIDAAPIVRDAHGWYVHPQLPRYVDGDADAFAAWIAANAIEVQCLWMKEDAPDLAHRYWAGKDVACVVADWNPPPFGPDWWLLALCDSPTGPVA